MAEEQKRKRKKKKENEEKGDKAKVGKGRKKDIAAWEKVHKEMKKGTS